MCHLRLLGDVVAHRALAVKSTEVPAVLSDHLHVGLHSLALVHVQLVDDEETLRHELQEESYQHQVDEEGDEGRVENPHEHQAGDVEEDQLGNEEPEALKRLVLHGVDGLFHALEGLCAQSFARPEQKHHRCCSDNHQAEAHGYSRRTQVSCIQSGLLPAKVSYRSQPSEAEPTQQGGLCRQRPEGRRPVRQLHLLELHLLLLQAGHKLVLCCR